MDERWHRLAAAAAFLTRLPIAAPERPLAEAMGFFPLVGAGIGLAAGVLYALLLAAGLPPLVAAAAAVGLAALITGALHEDGLADTADGLGARGDASARLAAMRDSRIGTFGALALALALVARVGAIAALDGTAATAALVAAGALSRTLFPALMLALPPARAEGLGAGAGRPGEGTLAAALGLGYLLAALAAGPWDAVLLTLAAALSAGGVALAAARRLGGYTGDVLGACQQAAEVAALALAAAFMGGAAS